MYQKEEFQLISPVDGLALSVLLTLPEESPGGVIQLIHGMGEYKERYLPLMEHLTREGYICIIHDRRGHGRSMERQMEDRGYFYGVGGQGLVEDIRAVQAYVRQRYPELKLFLFGHSMGSLEARCFLRRYDGSIRGLILSGPPARNSLTGAGLLLARLQRGMRGGRSLGKLLQTMAFGGYVARFPQSKYHWICANTEGIREDYEENPLCGFVFTADGFVALMELMRDTYSTRGWKCENPRLPVLMLAGGDDPCAGGEEGLRATAEHLRQRGYSSVTGKVYPGLRHEICNEREREQVFRDIGAFLARYT